MLDAARIGCSLVEYQFDLYLFGGFDTNGSLWTSMLKWTPGRAEWESVSIQGTICAPCMNTHFAVVYKDEMWVFGTIRSAQLGLRELCIAVFDFANRRWRIVQTHEPPSRAINEFSIHAHCLHEETVLVATEDGIYGYVFATHTWTSVYREQSLCLFHGQYHITSHVHHVIDDRMDRNE